MISPLYMRQSIAYCVIGFILFTAMAVNIQPAIAHGGGTVRLINAEAGPYRLFAWTQPEPLKAGDIHVSLAVTLETDQTVDIPVNDAEVTLHFTSSSTDEQFSVKARPEAELGGFYYEADAALSSAGEWQIRIEVQGKEGQGMAEFVSEALPAGSRNWLLLGSAGAGLLIIIILIIGLLRIFQIKI